MPDKHRPMNMTPNTDFDELTDDRSRRPQKVIDMKLPLPWLIGTAASIIGAFTLLYNNVDRLVRDVNELQATVRAGNVQSSATAGEIALLKYRVESIESSMKRAAESQRTGK